MPPKIKFELGRVEMVDDEMVADIDAIGRDILSSTVIDSVRAERRKRLFEYLMNVGNSRELPAQQVRIYLDDLASRCFDGPNTDWDNYSLDELESKSRNMLEIKNVELTSSLCSYIPEFARPMTTHRLDDIDYSRISRFQLWFMDHEKQLDRQGTLNKLLDARSYQKEDESRRNYKCHDPRINKLDESLINNENLKHASWAEISNIASIYNIPDFRAVKNK